MGVRASRLKKPSQAGKLLWTILVLLVLLWVASLFPASSGKAFAVERPRGQGAKDPLDRLPPTPEEAHQKILQKEKKITQPVPPVRSGVKLAGVQTGVNIAIPYDWVTGYIDAAHGGGNVRVTLCRSGGDVYSVDVPSQSDGWFFADLSPAAGGILHGDTVRITDLSDVPPTPVDIPVNLTGSVSLVQNRVSGTTLGDSTVDIYIDAPSTYYEDIPPGSAHKQVVASSLGNYSADFDQFPLRVGDAAYIYSTYPSGHVVMEVARTDPSLVVYPQYDEVLGYYTPASNFIVSIAGGPSRSTTTRGDGFFDAWFSDYDILEGDVVSSNWIPSKSVTVPNIIAYAEPQDDMIRGQVLEAIPTVRLVRIVLNPYSGPMVFERPTDDKGNFSVDLEGIYELVGNEVFNVCWYDDDWDAVVYEFTTYSWYFAEGTTNPGFQEYLCLGNPSDTVAELEITYIFSDGSTQNQQVSVAPNFRNTVNVNSIVGPGKDVSIKVVVTNGTLTVAERPIYFAYNGVWTGGSDVVGTNSPATEWYFAEGYTGSGFEEWVCVLNTGDEAATLTFFFQTQEAGLITKSGYSVGAHSRKSFFINDVLGPGYQNSLKLVSSKPVVAERPMYFRYGSWTGGHCVMGSTVLGSELYFAEGTTRGGFHEYLTLQNPNSYDITVEAHYQLGPGQGSVPPIFYPIQANKRQTVFVPSEVGYEKDVSVLLLCEDPFLAERPMYFRYGSWTGGHCVIGAPAPGPEWFLAEGCTYSGFDEWITLQNPGTQDAQVQIDYYTQESGHLPPRIIPVPAGTRVQVKVNDNAGKNLNLSCRLLVLSGSDIVVERPMYFIVFGWDGGHDVVGYRP